MTRTQKIIKYVATAFAIFLIITIISAILKGVYGLASALGLKHKKVTDQIETINFENSEVAILNIDIAFTNLIIKDGDYLRAETNNTNISCKQNYQNLQIKENINSFIGKSSGGDLVVYVPKDLSFEVVKINTGAGKVNIENLNTKELELEVGAGETQIKNLNVEKQCKINGGAGKVTIFSGIINNLDLDMGIGETNLFATLNGKNDIDAGIGNLNITLFGNKSNYKIKTDKGIGSIKVDEMDMHDNQIWGNGENYIEVDGGIGQIKINFKQ